MNLILGVVLCCAALYIKLHYRPEGGAINQLFRMSLLSGLFAMLTRNSMSAPVLIVLFAVQVVLCLSMLYVFRACAMSCASDRAINVTESKARSCNSTKQRSSVRNTRAVGKPGKRSVYSKHSKRGCIGCSSRRPELTDFRTSAA